MHHKRYSNRGEEEAWSTESQEAANMGEEIVCSDMYQVESPSRRL